MIMSYASKTTAAQSGASTEGWLAKLMEGKPSNAQIEMGIFEGMTETIKEINEKALEKSKETNKETDKETGEGGEVKMAKDEIKDPSEVTKADLQSPIDIKL